MQAKVKKGLKALTDTGDTVIHRGSSCLSSGHHSYKQVLKYSFMPPKARNGEDKHGDMKSFLKGRYIKLRGALILHSVDREILLYPGGTIHLQDLYLYFGKYRTREIKRGVRPLSDS